MTDSDRATLRECPFCSSRNVTINTGSNWQSGPWYYGHCLDCHANTAIRSTWEEAYTAWNTRAPGYAAGVEAALAIIRKREALDATQHDMLVALGMEIAALAPAVPEEQTGILCEFASAEDVAGRGPVTRVIVEYAGKPPASVLNALFEPVRVITALRGE